MRFTRSGRRLCTAAGDDWEHLWNVETGGLLQVFDATPRAAEGAERQAEDLDIHIALSPNEGKRPGNTG